MALYFGAKELYGNLLLAMPEGHNEITIRQLSKYREMVKEKLYMLDTVSDHVYFDDNNDSLTCSVERWKEPFGFDMRENRIYMDPTKKIEFRKYLNKCLSLKHNEDVVKTLRCAAVELSNDIIRSNKVAEA